MECNRCGKEFRSVDVGNRRCPACERKIEKLRLGKAAIVVRFNDMGGRVFKKGLERHE